MRPSVFFAFYDGGEWEIGGESMYVCDHTNQHLLYHPMQGEAAFENPKLFCVGVFQKKKKQPKCIIFPLPALKWELMGTIAYLQAMK